MERREIPVTVGDNGGHKVATWIRDWIPLILLVVSGLVWGMKLENNLALINDRLLAINNRLASVEGQVGRGILPLAEAKFEANRDKISDIERRLQQIEGDHARFQRGTPTKN